MHFVMFLTFVALNRAPLSTAARSWIFTVQRYASVVYAVIVCLSVTCRSSTKMPEPRITQTRPYNSTVTLVF